MLSEHKALMTVATTTPQGITVICHNLFSLLHSNTFLDSKYLFTASHFMWGAQIVGSSFSRLPFLILALYSVKKNGGIFRLSHERCLFLFR